MTQTTTSNSNRRGLLLVIGIIIALLGICVAYSAKSQTTKEQTMKMNAGIITTKLQESKEFYTTVLDFGVVFENEFYLLLHTPNNQAELSFLLPNHPTQQPLFQPAFAGKGIFLTIEVKNVDEWYKKIQAMNIPIMIALRNEPWGDKHFAIQDPNGIGIDIVTYSAPEEKPQEK